MTRTARLRWTPAVPVLIVTVILFGVSPTIVGGSLGRGPLATMLPFASVLALTAVGQTLVVQQAGVDFSVPGTVSLSAVVLTKFAHQSASRLPAAIILVALLAVTIGLLNGLIVARLNVTPIIATLGVNALVIGAMRRYSGGVSVPPAPPLIRRFSQGKTLGLHNPVIIAAVVVAVVSIGVKRTLVGRRFEVSGARRAAARVAGVRVTTYQVAAYVLASLCYAIAGITLASFLSAPRIDAGDPYLLGSIAATVIGGTALTGGAGSVVGAAVGALFLTQLSQLLLGSGLNTAVNFVVQGAVIAASMAARTAGESLTRSRNQRAALASIETDLITGEPSASPPTVLLGDQP